MPPTFKYLWTKNETIYFFLLSFVSLRACVRAFLGFLVPILTLLTKGLRPLSLYCR